MSKFLDLVEKNTPINEGAEPLGQFKNRLEGLYNTDYMKTFIDSYHALAEDIQGEEPFEVEDIIKFLTFKMEEFPPTVEDNEVDPEELPAEDFEFMDKGRQKKVDTFNKQSGNITGTLAAANELRAADPDPKRPSRGVKQINSAVDKMGRAVAKNIKRVTKMIK